MKNKQQNKVGSGLKERVLSVLAGYSEVQDSDNYIANITRITDKIKEMRQELMDVKDNALKKISNINKSIGILDSDANLNRMLNNEFADQLEKILN